MGPIHPFLTDIEAVFNTISPFVKFIMGETPNLRCGNWNDLAKALISLDIDPVEYRCIAESQNFYQETVGLVKKMCERSSVNFRGIFSH